MLQRDHPLEWFAVLILLRGSIFYCKFHSVFCDAYIQKDLVQLDGSAFAWEHVSIVSHGAWRYLSSNNTSQHLHFDGIDAVGEHFRVSFGVRGDAYLQIETSSGPVQVA